jgi:NAD dependent epimerase/dehydratase family enzyme
MFGEMANVLLEGSRVSNQKLINNGLKFKFRTLSEALVDIISKK